MVNENWTPGLQAVVDHNSVADLAREAEASSVAGLALAGICLSEVKTVPGTNASAESQGRVSSTDFYLSVFGYESMGSPQSKQPEQAGDVGPSWLCKRNP